MLTLFFTVALVHIVALMSPGPDFFFVARKAIAENPEDIVAVEGHTH